jgi:hypothetical protein
LLVIALPQIVVLSVSTPVFSPRRRANKLASWLRFRSSSRSQAVHLLTPPFPRMTLGAPIMTKVPPPRFYSGSTMFASVRAFASSAVLQRFARIGSPDLRPETPPHLSWRKAANEKAPPQIRNPVAPELCTNNGTRHNRKPCRPTVSWAGAKASAKARRLCHRSIGRRSGESAKDGLCGLSPRGLWLCSRRGLCPGPGLGPLFASRRTVDLNGGAIDSNDVLP